MSTILRDEPETVSNFDLIEIENAVIPDVERFARALIEERRLAIPVSVERIELASVSEDLGCGVGGLADVEGYDSFFAWSQKWISEFARRVDGKAVNLKLIHARQPMCPRFHMDFVPMRFISTLSGPGSEWVKGEDVRYLADGTISQELNSKEIQYMKPGSVGFFRGCYGQTTPTGGVVHRSPQSNQDRVLLKMDLVT